MLSSQQYRNRINAETQRAYLSTLPHLRSPRLCGSTGFRRKREAFPRLFRQAVAIDRTVREMRDPPPRREERAEGFGIEEALVGAVIPAIRRDVGVVRRGFH